MYRFISTRTKVFQQGAAFAASAVARQDGAYAGGRFLCGYLARFTLSLTMLTVAYANVVELPMATGEYPPYVSASLPQQGIFTDRLRQALAAHKIIVKLKFTSWVRAEEMLARGQVFAIFPYKPNPQRRLRYEFSEPIIQSKSVLYFLKNNAPKLAHIELLQQLNGLTIGAVRGYWYEAALVQSGAKVVYFSDETAALRVLLVGRIDAMIQDDLVANYLIHTHLPKQQARFAHGKALQEQDPSLALMVSRSYPNAKNLLNTVNAALVNAPLAGHSPK